MAFPDNHRPLLKGTAMAASMEPSSGNACLGGSNSSCKDDLFKAPALPLPPSSQQTIMGEPQPLSHSVSHAQPLALTSLSSSAASSVALPTTGHAHQDPHMTSPPAGMRAAFNMSGSDAVGSSCSMTGTALPVSHPHPHAQMPHHTAPPPSAVMSPQQHRLQYMQEFQRMYGAGPYVEGCVY